MDIKIVIFLIFFGSWTVGQEDDEDERIRAEFQMLTYDLSDECTDRARVLKQYYLEPNRQNLDDKIDAEIDHGKLLRAQAHGMRKFEEVSVPYDLMRNWTLITKCGDPLLNETHYSNLIRFANENLQLTKKPITIKSTNDTEYNYSERDIEHELSSSRELEHLKAVWSSWQKHVGANHANFRDVLNLAVEAADENGQPGPGDYWEFLADIDDGYANAETLWDEFEPMYTSLHAFVLKRINKHYGTEFTSIPVYLTGTKFGDDWTSLADIVLPHPQLYHDIKVELAEMDVNHIYKLAENFTRSIGLGSLGKHFWAHSNFTQSSCQSHVLTYCSADFSEVLCCNRTDLSAYLEAHRNAMRVVLDRVDYVDLPQRNLKLNPVVEAMYELASLHGMNHLEYYGILPNAVFIKEEVGETNRMNAVLLTALRLFPKIAYYYSVDMWRLHELENPSEDIVARWWEIRKKYQMVEGIDNTEADFMGDEMVLYNKPYLSKYLGAFMQFQFLNYHQLSFYREVTNMASVFRHDSSFKEMLTNLNSRDALELVGYYYRFDDVSSYPISDFFSGLSDFLEEAPEEQAGFVVNKPRYQKPEGRTAKPRTRVRAKTSAAPTTTVETTTELPTTAVERQLSTIAAEEEKNRAGGYAVWYIIGGTMAAIIGVIVWKRARDRRSRGIPVRTT